MEDSFYEEELLYRGVIPSETFIKKDGTITSAAFKNRSGESSVSVDRQARRDNKDALSFAISHLHGTIVTVTVADVHLCGAMIISDPCVDQNGFKNDYHSSIMNNGERTRLTGSQSRLLSRAAKVVYSSSSY